MSQFIVWRQFDICSRWISKRITRMTISC